MTTIYKISEQILRIHLGGDPSVSAIKRQEVEELVQQYVNAQLKSDNLNVNLPSGETIPAGYVITHYDNIKVEKWKDRSRIKLPATPIALPRDIGMFHVGPAGEPGEFYVPIPPGYHGLIKTNKMLNHLNGRIGYTRNDNFLYFTRDITLPDEDVFVDVQIVGLDISKYSKYDVLPIPPDMEAIVIEKVLTVLSGKGAQTNLVDSVNQKQAK